MVRAVVHRDDELFFAVVGIETDVGKHGGGGNAFVLQIGECSIGGARVAAVPYGVGRALCVLFGHAVPCSLHFAFDCPGRFAVRNLFGTRGAVVLGEGKAIVFGHVEQRADMDMAVFEALPLGVGFALIPFRVAASPVFPQAPATFVKFGFESRAGLPPGFAVVRVEVGQGAADFVVVGFVGYRHDLFLKGFRQPAFPVCRHGRVVLPTADGCPRKRLQRQFPPAG